jgi:hypothetical protein
MDRNTVVQGQHHVQGRGWYLGPVPFDFGDELRKGIYKIPQPRKDLVPGQQCFHHHEAHEVQAEVA